MRTAVGLELKAVRVIRRGDDQRVLVPVRNGHLADVSEKNATQESATVILPTTASEKDATQESEKNATQESWRLTKCGPSRT